ncbi:MAG: hypothetical protein GXP55_03850 [Deltaproteobacteria bacterium]|nr:hypothetical protein [Deltaproteobacteria bacterium]
MRSLAHIAIAPMLFLALGCAGRAAPSGEPAADYAQCSAEVARAVAAHRQPLVLSPRLERARLAAELVQVAAACREEPASAACSTAGILALADADLNDTEAYDRALPFFQKACKAGQGSCQAVTAIELLERRELGDSAAETALAACIYRGEGCTPIARFMPGRLRVHVTLYGCMAGNEPACNVVRSWYGGGLRIYLPRELASIRQIARVPCEGRCAPELAARADALGESDLDRGGIDRMSALYRQACELEPIYCSGLITHVGLTRMGRVPLEELARACDAGDCQGLAVLMRNPIPIDRLSGAFRDLNFDDACSAAFAVHACEQQGQASACWQSARIYTNGNSAIAPDRARARALFRTGCALIAPASCEAFAPR